MLGLIAGKGKVPLEIALAGRRAQHSIHAIGFNGLTSPELVSLVDGFRWLPLGAVNALLEDFRSKGVRELVMAGKVDKRNLLGSGITLELDDRAKQLLAEMTDRSDSGFLSHIADFLESEGFVLKPQAELIPELCLRPGLLGRLRPSEEQLADLAIGWPIAGQIAQAGIGQCVVVKDRVVVAVEALEGTDATIGRAAELVDSGLTVIKRAAPGHDPRFDLPVVGLDTLECFADTKHAFLALEAGPGLLLDRTEFSDRADRYGLAVMAFEDGKIPKGGYV